ncbi:hypothetical protein [Fournierella massiliensis]|uniref:hypothetical protein n=1 Tax=Allofournierella massiliensis TaxID=1650663 RepID=UPI003522C3FC
MPVELPHASWYDKGNTAQFTVCASGGVSRQNFPRYFPKMLAKPQRIACAFWFISQKISGALHHLKLCDIA